MTRISNSCPCRNTFCIGHVHECLETGLASIVIPCLQLSYFTENIVKWDVFDPSVKTANIIKLSDDDYLKCTEIGK